MRIFGSCRITHDLYAHIDSLDSLEGMVCVDIPAGGGLTSKRLRDRGATVEAYDLFPQFCRAEGIECRRADLSERLPIDDDHADLVICQEGIEHLPDQLHAMREFSRDVLFGKHTFLIFVKEQSQAEAEASFHTKLNAHGAEDDGPDAGGGARGPCA